MNPDLKPGLHHVQTLRVNPSLTVPALSHTFTGFADMPPVFATSLMVGFIEWACVEALRPYLAPGERTVGTAVDVSHVAATPVGMIVTATVDLIEVRRHILRFKVSCHDEADLIGAGFHERAVINHDWFVGRVERKKAKISADGTDC